MKINKFFSTTLVIVILLQFLCLPVFAEEDSTPFIQTAKVGSTKIVKNGIDYDMYNYTGGVAVLQKEADGTIIIPIRIVSELAELNVAWDGEAHKITLTDPVTEEYWELHINAEWAVKYNSAGTQIGLHYMSWFPELRGGATYISIDDIPALYGFQVHERDYENDTYVIISNKSLTLTAQEITALCEEASELI